MVTCRPLGATDGEAWQRIFESVAAEGKWIGAEVPVSGWSEKIVDEYADRSERVLFLAELDATPVGWITVDLQPGGTAELGMGVLSTHRRQGVGTAMMEVAIDWAVTNGAGRLALDVFPHNEPAISLYRKFGFVEVEVRAKAWERRDGELWDLLAMERRLPTRGR